MGNIDFTPLLVLALIGLATIITGFFAGCGAVIGVALTVITHNLLFSTCGVLVGAMLGIAIALWPCILIWRDR